MGDILRTLGQGFRSFATDTPLSQIQDTDEARRLTQIIQQSGDITSPEFQQLSALAPTQATKIGGLLGNIGVKRETDLFQDARKVRLQLEANDLDGAADTLFDRVNKIQGQGGDPKDTMEIGQDIVAGNIQGALEKLRLTERVGVDRGFLKDPEGIQGKTAAIQEFQFKTKGLSAEQVKNAKLISLGLKGREVKGASKVFDIGGVPHIVDGVGNVRRLLIDGDTVTTETVADSKSSIAAAVTTAEGEAEIPLDTKKLLRTSNIKRISTLRDDTNKRKSAIKKANEFVQAFETGGAQSGASRTGLGFIPGVFTNQAQFDERLNAFAEVAARAALKANGEVRPTDADVEGMKRAMFGVGRDESTNIQLLNEFITDQEADNNELRDLIQAGKAGNIDSFVSIKEPPLSPEERAELEALRAKHGNR